MPFTELVLFVHSGVQFEDLAWNKVGVSFETKLWPTSHVAGSEEHKLQYRVGS